MMTTRKEIIGLNAASGSTYWKRGAIIAPTIAAIVPEMMNKKTLARAVLMPACTATISSLPIIRSANPRRERPISQPIR